MPSEWDQYATPSPMPGAQPQAASDNWDQYASAPGPTTAPPSALSRYGSSFAKTTGVPQIIDAAKNYAASQPTTLWGAVKQGLSDSVTKSPPAIAARLAKSILMQSGQQLGKAYDAATKGDYPGQPLSQRALETAGYVGSAALPIVGPMAAEAGEQIGSGDIAGGLGTATGVIVSAVAPSLLGGAKNVGKSVAGAFEADPTVAIVKALRPVASNEGFTERLPETLANIKASAGSPVTGNLPLIAATKKAIANHQNALEQWMAPARQIKTQVSGDPVVQATSSAIPDSLRLEDPSAAQSIVDQANTAYGGKSFSVDDMRALLKEKNAELSAFYSRAEGKQAAAVTSGKPEAVVKAQRDAIADSLYNALDPSNQGAGPRQIQSQTGDMIDILDAANRRKNAIIGEKPVSTAGAIGKTAADLINLPGKVVTGDVGTALSAFPETWHGTSDPLIRRAFRAIGPPSPIPAPPTTPAIAGLLPSPPLVTPAPATPNPVTITTGAPLRAGPSRQLPSAPIVTPPPVDASRVNVSTGAPLTAPTTRQLSSGPSIRPLGDTGGGSAGDLTTDLVPVYDAQGKVKYYQQPRPGPHGMPPSKPPKSIANGLAADILSATKPTGSGTE